MNDKKYIPPMCSICKHRKNEIANTCKAYPYGIPVEITTGEIKHTKTYNQNNKYIFEPIKKYA